MLVTVGGRYMLSPSLPIMCGCGSASFSMMSWYAMIVTGSPVIVFDTGFQRATTPRTGTVAPSAGETSFGPAGMSCVSQAVPDVRPMLLPFSCAGPAIV